MLDAVLSEPNLNCFNRTELKQQNEIHIAYLEIHQNNVKGLVILSKLIEASLSITNYNDFMSHFDQLQLQNLCIQRIIFGDEDSNLDFSMGSVDVFEEGNG
jgi:hypothetical protein